MIHTFNLSADKAKQIKQEKGVTAESQLLEMTKRLCGLSGEQSSTAVAFQSPDLSQSALPGQYLTSMSAAGTSSRTNPITADSMDNPASGGYADPWLGNGYPGYHGGFGYQYQYPGAPIAVNTAPYPASSRSFKQSPDGNFMVSIPEDTANDSDESLDFE